MTCILALWAILFYSKVNDAVSDEVDDALQRQADAVIVKVLAGRGDADSLASVVGGKIRLVDAGYAASHPQIRFSDSEVYLPQYDDMEPVRILVTIFKDGAGNYYELVLQTPSFEKQDVAEAVAGWTAVLYVSLLLVLLAVGVWVVYKSLRPLYDLLKGLDAYRPGSGYIDVDESTDIAEFRRLNSAAKNAVVRSEEVFRQQKQFIGNASHELQTPIAVCRSRLEWLLDNTVLTERQIGEILHVQRTLDYVARLNKSLLLLSKIDNNQFTEKEPVNMGEIIAEQLENISEIYAGKGLNVEKSDEGACVFDMNGMLASIMVSNLVKNAFVHNCAGGHVRIRIFSGGFSVGNTSGQSQPLDSERIFMRFYHGGGSESSGLGLSIVQAVCRNSGLDVSYGMSEGLHVFTVKRMKIY